MQNLNDNWTLKKYLLYDFAGDRLASRNLFVSHDQAAQFASRHANVMIVALVLSQASAPASAHLTNRRTRSKR